MPPEDDSMRQSERNIMSHSTDYTGDEHKMRDALKCPLRLKNIQAIDTPVGLVDVARAFRNSPSSPDSPYSIATCRGVLHLLQVVPG